MMDERHPKARKRVGPEQWPQWLEAHVGDAKVYRPFIHDGDLAFDVGANRGIKTYAMRKLGADVVAVEPLAGHPSDLVPHLKHVFGDDPHVKIIAQALGAKEGEVTLWAHGVFPGYSSTNKGWIKTRELQDSVIECTVPVTTLDKLIERFGLPVFIKIDVEAGEHRVLAGLSTPVAALNFEFHKGFMGVARKCIGLLEKLATYEYNYVHATQDKFALKHWEPADKIRETLAALPAKGPESWGDVYARRR